MNLTAPKPLTYVSWLLTALKPALKDEPVAVRPDADTAHGFSYGGGGKIVVRVNPARQALLDDRNRALRKARVDRVNSADAVREQKLKDVKARAAAEIDAIENEYISIEVTATKEFLAAEQALLAEFSQALPVAAAP